jgi:hypothetical protein
MAYDGLEKTGVYFRGVKFACQAHYPLITDYVEETVTGREGVNAFVEKHTAAGANVQVHEHKWVETFVASGWYPAHSVQGKNKRVK